MIFFPAIDLKEGKCVRLVKGNMKKTTVFNNSPTEQARLFQNSGCSWLHLVDLDGAVKGQNINSKSVKEIINSTDLKIQLGGGIRKKEQVETWLEYGVKKVVLGTVAAKEPRVVRELAKAYPKMVGVGVDALNGEVAIEGWTKNSKIRAIDLCKLYEDSGVASIIYTDINRDGAMKGPNIEETLKIAASLSTPVIASGGISSMNDLVQLFEEGKSLIEGVIVGRAIYENKIKLKDALHILAGS